MESGIEVLPFYTEEHVRAADTGTGIGKPGEHPFTRGIHREMYRRRPFTIRQYSGFGTAEETRERFRYLLQHGNTALNVALDLPTQCGLDSDDPRAAAEVGRVGMAVDTVDDLAIAFDGIDLDEVSVSLTVNGSAPVLLAMFQVVAERQGRDLSRLRGTLQNDILKEFIGRGTWIFPVEPSVRLVCDVVEYCARHLPRYSPVSVCGYHIRETGATPVQEIAYAFCIARAYIDRVLERGVPIDEFASRLSFNFNVFGSLFEQVAKFRAGRRLWARIVRERYGAKDPASGWLRMIAGGGGGGLTVEQPENNIVRGAYYALISALSGTQTMALCSFDEAYTIPSERAARLSLRTMQVLLEEMGVADTVDPLGGSWYVETLTHEMERLIVACMDDVDARGGIERLIAEGEVQSQLSRQAWRRQQDLESGAVRKVGVNCHRVEEEEPEVEVHGYDPGAVGRQIARLEEVRRRRDGVAVEAALARVRRDAGEGRNAMPAIVEAVRALATVGEVTRALADVLGTWKEPIRF
ncbi:methylmalonyl-CoA mutase family protein [Myxococcota bacterium]|nr:methylmalonyl-CoA mutase family protein [Myxococcota bacterium]